jgi:DNA-directed RNA polymerase subunit beta'
MNIPNSNTSLLPGVVIPDAFAQPEWVEQTFERFKKTILEDYQKSKSINPINTRKAIKDIILDGKCSPAFPLNKKNINKLLEKMYDAFDDIEFQWRYLLLYRVGFFLSTFTANSFTPESLKLPKQFIPKRKKVIDEYRERLHSSKNEKERQDAILWVDKSFKKLADEVLEYFREHDDRYPIIHSIDSGSKGSADDLRKLLIAIGLSINAKNEINDVIDKSGAEGLTPTQFFNYSSQAIVSQYKKSKDTAIPGYLIRQLNTISSSVVLSKTVDCGTTRYLKLKVLNKNMLEALEGKILKDGKTLDKSMTDLIGKTIHIRSPLYCKAKDGICKVCYNPKFADKMNLESNAGIGLLASTSQANMLTSITLKAAHAGLSLKKESVNLKEDIFNYSD